jgi:hypothetical protein
VSKVGSLLRIDSITKEIKIIGRAANFCEEVNNAFPTNRSAGSVRRGAEGLKDDIFGVLKGAGLQALLDDGFDFGLFNLNGHGGDLERYLHASELVVTESRFRLACIIGSTFSKESDDEIQGRMQPRRFRFFGVGSSLLSSGFK